MVHLTKNGWARIDAQHAHGLTAVSVHRRTTHLRAGPPATVLTWVAAQIDGAGIERAATVFGWRDPALNAQVGGIANSNHLSGTAIDYNGGRHPYEHTHAARWSSGWNAAQQRQIREILAATGGTVGWGLDYGVGWRDAMHFEIVAGADRAQQAADKLTTGWVTVASDFLNGRAKPSTKARITFVRTKGFRIRYVEVAYREGRIWLRTAYRTWYAADLTTW